MSYPECVCIYSFNALSILVCQPRPLVLKNSKTSRDNRRVVCTFVGTFCGPLTFKRPSLYALTTSGTTSEAGRIRLKSSFVSSLTSPFLSIRCFFIIFYLSFIRFPQRDYTNCARRYGKCHHMQSVINESRSNISLFSVIGLFVSNNFCSLPLEALDLSKINTMFKQVFYSLVIIPLIPYSVKAKISYDMIPEILGDC